MHVDVVLCCFVTFKWCCHQNTVVVEQFIIIVMRRFCNSLCVIHIIRHSPPPHPIYPQLPTIPATICTLRQLIQEKIVVIQQVPKEFWKKPSSTRRFLRVFMGLNSSRFHFRPAKRPVAVVVVLFSTPTHLYNLLRVVQQARINMVQCHHVGGVLMINLPHHQQQCSKNNYHIKRT